MDKQDEAAKRLFGEAVGLPRDRRSAFLDGACAGEPALRREVEDLLDSNDRLSGFLSEPAYVHAAAEAGMASQTVVLTAGARLLERYVIIGNLGAGGMGVVYRARDEKLDRDVAIKMLQRGLLTSDEARSRFRREAQALAKLNHAHIAAVHDVIEQDGADCIVMELVEGESLAAKLRRGALQVKEATIIALQIAQALEEAHEQGRGPPRSETGQCHDYPERASKGARLRARQAAVGPGGCDPGRSRDGRGDGNATVYVAGAGDGRDGGCAERPLEPGRDLLRVADGDRAVSPADDAGDSASDHR